MTPSRAISDSGDYLTLQLVDRPVLVVRGGDGRARVLLNACRHRGAVVVQGSGCERRFTCPYHNWVYDTSGSLVGLPGRECFDDVDIAELGLVELPSEERHGFVWALRDPNGVLDLERCGQGLAAGRTDVILGRNEIGCQAAHRQILADLAGDADREIPTQPAASFAG